MTDDIVAAGRPVFRIGTVAELLSVHPRTLRLYEERGLILPQRVRGQRRYSANDVRWLGCVRSLIHEHGFSIDAIIRLLDFAPCWELVDCPEETRDGCKAAVDRRLRCWQIAARTCARTDTTCDECEVYLRDLTLARNNKPVS